MLCSGWRSSPRVPLNPSRLGNPPSQDAKALKPSRAGSSHRREGFRGRQGEGGERKRHSWRQEQNQKKKQILDYT